MFNSTFVPSLAFCVSSISTLKLSSRVFSCHRSPWILQCSILGHTDTCKCIFAAVKSNLERHMAISHTGVCILKRKECLATQGTARFPHLKMEGRNCQNTECIKFSSWVVDGRFRSFACDKLTNCMKLFRKLYGGSVRLWCRVTMRTDKFRLRRRVFLEVIPNCSPQKPQSKSLFSYPDFLLVLFSKLIICQHISSPVVSSQPCFQKNEKLAGTIDKTNFPLQERDQWLQSLAYK